MAEIQFINSYPKVGVQSKNGVPVMENGQLVKTVKTMFRYGIVNATPQEIALYKKSKVTESGDYYREENGVPLWHSSDFKGFKCTIRAYEKDGQIRFAVDSSMVDAYTAIAEKTPALATAMAEMIAGELLAGGRLNLDNAKTDGSPNVETTPIDNSTGSGTPDDGATDAPEDAPASGEEKKPAKKG